jgi:predicted transcriptional regulator
MAKGQGSVGDRELELLRWIERSGDATVGEAAEGFGAPFDQTAGLARSTVLTMMERLRKKGLLERRAVDGVYRYRLAVSAGDVARRAVASFVEGTLGGSLAPFVAYLAESERLSARQVKELEALLDRPAESKGRRRP